MEFHEAVEIAKRNPGALLVRDDAGGFLVRSSDGSLIDDGPKNSVGQRKGLDEIQSEIDFQKRQIESLRRERDSGFQERDQRILTLESELVALNKDLISQLRSKDLVIESLRREINDNNRKFDEIVSDKLKVKIEEIKSEKDSILRMRSSLVDSQNKIDSEMRDLQILKDAYANKFGYAEVVEVTKTIENREVCTRCGGDGGVNGGCGKCDGTGWMISSVNDVRHEVKFK